MKTFIGYDKNGERVRGYMLKNYNWNELKKYMTLEDYEKIEYIQELKYDQKTTHNEDGSINKNIDEWKWANTRKYYIHK